jgi:hypothetical protein
MVPNRSVLVGLVMDLSSWMGGVLRRESEQSRVAGWLAFRDAATNSCLQCLNFC